MDQPAEGPSSTGGCSGGGTFNARQACDRASMMSGSDGSRESDDDYYSVEGEESGTASVASGECQAQRPMGTALTVCAAGVCEASGLDGPFAICALLGPPMPRTKLISAHSGAQLLQVEAMTATPS